MWKITHACPYVASGTTPKSDGDNYYDGENLWVTTGELREGVIIDTVKKVTDKALIDMPTLRLHPEGSVAIAMYGATIGRLGIFGREATTNQACCVMPPSNILYNRYLFYWLFATRQEIINLSSGGGQPNVNQEKIASLKVSAPDYRLQEKISDFLGHETAKIDTLIEKQQQLIKLLKEKRQAVISHAVTKGLNPSASMRGSGVEWLGDVPAHFQVKRLKHASAGITVGIVVEPSKYYVDEGIPCFRSLNVRKMSLIGENLVHISPESNELLKKSILRSGDLVAVRTGQPGTTAVVDEEFDGTNCIDLIIIRRSENFLSKYLGYFLNSDVAIMQYAAGSGGAIQQHFNVQTAGNLLIVLPPLLDQKHIVDYLDKATSQFDSLIERAEQAVRLQEERRTALISAAVTGKIDVRNWQAPSETTNQKIAA